MRATKLKGWTVNQSTAVVSDADVVDMRMLSKFGREGREGAETWPPCFSPTEQIAIPTDLADILKAYTKEVIRRQPENLVDFSAK